MIHRPMSPLACLGVQMLYCHSSPVAYHIISYHMYHVVSSVHLAAFKCVYHITYVYITFDLTARLSASRHALWDVSAACSTGAWSPSTMRYKRCFFVSSLHPSALFACVYREQLKPTGVTKEGMNTGACFFFFFLFCAPPSAPRCSLSFFFARRFSCPLRS